MGEYLDAALKYVDEVKREQEPVLLIEVAHEIHLEDLQES